MRIPSLRHRGVLAKETRPLHCIPQVPPPVALGQQLRRQNDNEKYDLEEGKVKIQACEGQVVLLGPSEKRCCQFAKAGHRCSRNQISQVTFFVTNDSSVLQSE